MPAGQTQKEFFVNEAFVLVDMLLGLVIAGERDDPPPEAADGDCWLVGPSPTEQWTGHAGELASWQASGWLFVAPIPGLNLHDLSTGGSLRFNSAWQRLAAPAGPSGGEVVDSQAREAIGNIVASLRAAGIYPAE